MSDTIRQLAEHVYDNVRNCSCDDDCVASIENTLRTLAPTIPIGREEMGKMLYEVGANKRYDLMGLDSSDWSKLIPSQKQVYIESASTFAASIASSLQEKKGSGIACQFCGEHDFDLAGLKSHLSNGDCDEFNNLETLVVS